MAYRYNPYPNETSKQDKISLYGYDSVLNKPTAAPSVPVPQTDVPRPSTALGGNLAEGANKANNTNSVYKYQQNNVGGDVGGNVDGNVGGNAGSGIGGYYDRLMALYGDRLNAEKARQGEIKQARINAANKVYDTSLANLNDARDSSLQQAYIKHLQEQKALPQQMQAYGINGGATETNLANMKNVYGQNRTSIMNEAMAQQRLIEQDRANAIANAEADAANYEASAVRDYNDGLLNLYASALSKPTYTSTATPTSNIKNNVWYEQATNMLSEGYTRPEIIANLDANGVSEDIIDAIMSSWDSTF